MMRRTPLARAGRLSPRSRSERAVKAARRRVLAKPPAAPMLVGKGPVKDPAYVEFIGSLSCCVCDAQQLTQNLLTEAHHARECFERTMGLRIGDHCCVPLCIAHHQDAYPRSVHAMGRFEWWEYQGVDPFRLMLEMLRQAHPEGTNEAADRSAAKIRARWEWLQPSAAPPLTDRKEA